MYRFIVFLSCFFMCNLLTIARTYKVFSPDNKLMITIDVSNVLTWGITYDKDVIIEPSEISLDFTDKDMNTGFNVVNHIRRNINEKRKAFLYKKEEIISHFNEIEFELKNGCKLQVRAYDNGAAYRFINSDKRNILNNEISNYRFSNNHKCYIPYVCDLRDNDQYCSAFESLYDKLCINDIKNDSLCLTPMMVCLENGIKAVICESGLYDYPGMFLERNLNQINTLKASFAKSPSSFYIGGFNNLNEMPKERNNYIAKLSPEQKLPWRIVMISDEDSEILDSDLVYDMAGECEIEDVSWIKPGKAAWDWWNDWNITGVNFKAGCNTSTYKHYVDFASKYGLEYVVIDEGWSSNAKDIDNINPELDLNELISYSKQKNVGIILWASYLGIKGKEDYYFSRYSQMGIKGFKIDFFDRDDQLMVNYCYELARKAANYHLVLDMHGMFKPSGLNVRYPNVLSFEGVRGLENCKWHNYDMPDYDVTMPFLRMQAGPVDYTPGAMGNASSGVFRPISQQPMSMGTRVHQLASYIVFDSPLQMLCDSPSFYERDTVCTSFIAKIPTYFEEYRPLKSEIGKYVSVAKRKGSEWFVGALTDWDSRTITIDFSFLPEGKYEAVVFEDGVNAGKNASDYCNYKLIITPSSVKQFLLASGGGLAIRINRL